MDIHASGHAQQEDLKLMINLVKPRYLIPIHGHRFMLEMHANLAQDVGMAQNHIAIVGNGRIMTLKNNRLNITPEKVPTNYVMVDGLGIGDVGEIVLRDRQALSKDGMVVIISVVNTNTGKVKGNPDIISRGFVYLRESKPLLAEIDRQALSKDGMVVIISVVNTNTGKVKGNPDIISRGFVYLRESKPLLAEIRKKTKAIVEHATSEQHTANWDYVKDNIKEQLGTLIYKKTQRRPMVLPVIIQV